MIENKEYAGKSKRHLELELQKNKIIMIEDHIWIYKLRTSIFCKKIGFILFNENDICDAVFVRRYYFFQKIDTYIL